MVGEDIWIYALYKLKVAHRRKWIHS